MPAFALGLSLFATLLSTLSYLSYPGEVIAHGPMIFTLVAAHLLIFVIVGYGLIPLLMRQPVTSAYEILETKLGKPIRLAGASIFLLLHLGWMATTLYVTSSTVLIPLLRLDSSWTTTLCLGMGIVTAIYFSLGGFGPLLSRMRSNRSRCCWAGSSLWLLSPIAWVGLPLGGPRRGLVTGNPQVGESICFSWRC